MTHRPGTGNSAKAVGSSSLRSSTPSSASITGLGHGLPIDQEIRTTIQPHFPINLDRIRIHQDGEAHRAAAALSAEAFTIGPHIVFGKDRYAPLTSTGRNLLLHELAHAAESAATGERVIRRRILPTDVSQQLVGRSFSLNDAVTVGAVTLAAGEVVQVVAYDNALPTVKVTHPGVAAPFDVPKHLLDPVVTKVAGVAPYSAGLSRLQGPVKKGEGEIDAFKKTEPTFKSAKAKAFFAKELGQRTTEQSRRERALNVRLIQGAMLNRFDASIANWVDHYNTQFGFKDKDACDPNLIKAAMFRESQMGTNDDRATVPPTHPIQNQFNLLQAIDSWPLEQLLVMHDEAPGLIAKYHLENIEKDLLAVESELDRLKAKRTRAAVEESRLTALKALSDHDWQPWFVQYKAPGEATGFVDAMGEFLGTVSGGKTHAEDYDFWIRVGVRAIFEKHKLVKSWDQALRAYNGRGPGAENYRKEVVKRAKDAVTAEKAGKDYVPEKL